jgi:hypothetical protein
VNRQDVIDGMGHDQILGRDPRREWKITQIMLLVDKYAADHAAAEVSKALAPHGGWDGVFR